MGVRIEAKGTKLRKKQKDRLKKARAKMRKFGGTMVWRDGKPVVIGAVRPAKEEVEEPLELSN